MPHVSQRFALKTLALSSAHFPVLERRRVFETRARRLPILKDIASDELVDYTFFLGQKLDFLTVVYKLQTWSYS